MSDVPKYLRGADTPPPRPPPIPDLLRPEMSAPFFGEGKWRRSIMRKVRGVLRRPAD